MRAGRRQVQRGIPVDGRPVYSKTVVAAGSFLIVPGRGVDWTAPGGLQPASQACSRERFRNTTAPVAARTTTPAAPAFTQTVPRKDVFPTFLLTYHLPASQVPKPRTAFLRLITVIYRTYPQVPPGQTTSRCAFGQTGPVAVGGRYFAVGR